MSKARDIADLDFNSPDIDGGNIDGATIGATTVTGTVVFNSAPTFNTAITMGSTLNVASSVGIAGTTVIDASRNLSINEDLNFGTNGFADISNTGTGAIRFKPSSQTLALTLSGANATFNGTVETGGTLYIPQWIEHSGDSNTYFGFPSGDQFKIVTGNTGRLHITGSESVWNEGGEDKDFRVESNNHANMFRVDAGTDKVAVKLSTSEPVNTLDVNGDISFTRTISKKVSTGSANSNYFTIYEKDFESSAFTTNQHWVRITGAGSTNGTHASAEFYITFKQQGGSKYFNIVPIEKTGLTIGYTYDASGGASSAGKLKIFAASGVGFYTYIQVFATARDGNSDDAITRGTFPMTDTGSGTAPSGMTTMAFPLNYGANKYQISGYASNQYVINEDSNDMDFRVESSGNANMLFVDGGANHVNIGTSSDFGGTLNVNDSIYVAETDTPRIRLRNIGNSDTELGVNGLGAGLDTFYIAQYAGLAANEWDFRLTGASREFAFIRGGVVNEGAGDSDFRVESSGDSSMLHVDAGNNEVGIGTSSPENRMEIRDSNASTSHARGLTITNSSLTANSRAGILFKNYDNHGASIYSPRTGSTQGKLVLATNTGYNTTEASTDPKLVILYAGGTEQYAAVNDARWFTDSSAFSNPTTDLFTASTTGANYPQTCFEVTMYGNGVSANEHQVFKGGGTFDYSSSSNGTAQNLTTYTNYHVGNALPAAPTFALSGNILQMTSYRQTNYDTYRIEVRVWGRSTTQAWGTHQ